MTSVKMDPRKLRTLGKAAGLNPRIMFKLSPPDIAKALKEIDAEMFGDVETWDTDKAIEVAKQLEAAKAPKKEELKQEEVQETSEEIVVEEKPVKEEEPKEKPVQKVAEKPKGRSKGKGTKTAEKSEPSRNVPSRKRPKKKFSGAVTEKVQSQADFLEMKERLVFLEDQVIATRSMLNELISSQNEMMLFFTWWHNKYLNEDPEPEIFGIDWEACIKEQLK